MIWLAAAVAILLLSLALQAGLVAFAGYVLLGVLLVSRYLSREWVTRLTAVRELDTFPRVAGESVEVVLTLTNDGKLPVPWVLVEDMLPESALEQRPPRLTVKGRRLQVVSLRPGGTKTLKYRVTFAMRGYYPVGPCVLETGDVFGLHRRHRVAAGPAFVMVLPKVVPLPKYDFASRRPIGEVRLANRLFEDPTRTAGVRPYVVGDPLQRVHWRATARTGQLHCRLYEPTTLAGATLLVDFHRDGYHKRGEPYRSDLAVTAAASIAYALSVLNQPLGLVSNGRDAAQRIRAESMVGDGAAERDGEQGYATRAAARERYELLSQNDRLRPVTVDTRRGVDQFPQVREALARLELADGLTFAELLLETAPRLPRDATAIAVLPRVPVETAVSLGTLRRQGFAVSVLLIGLTDDERTAAHGRLLGEGVRDVRWVNAEADLAALGGRITLPEATPYEFDDAVAE